MIPYLAILLSLFMWFAPLWAETAQELEKQAQKQRRTGRVILNFQNADISAVIKFMSELTGKNIVLDPNVKGTITVSSSKPVSIKEAWDIFLLALSLQGYVAVEDKNVVRIVPSGQAPALASPKRPKSLGEVIIHLYKAENVQAVQLQQAIQPFLSPFARVAIHPQSNTLLIADTAKNVEKIKDILRNLDSEKSAIKVRIYPLSRAKAESVFQSLNPLTLAFREQMGSPVFITYNRESNSLVVASREEAHRILSEIIEALDRESLGGVERSFYLIPLKFVSAEEVYRSLQSLFKGITGPVQTFQTPREAQPQPQEIRGLETPLRREREIPKSQAIELTPIETKEGLRIGFDRGTNSVILYATKQEYEGIKELIDKIDVKRKQVLIAATVVEMSTSQALNLGVRWQVLGTRGGAAFGGGSAQDIYNSLLSGSFIFGVLSSAGRTISIGGVNLLFPDLVLLFSLLEKGSGFNIVSNPKVLTLDNQPAQIKVGQVIPFASGVKFDINGQPVITYDYKEVGLDLQVIPSISGKDLRMEINLRLQEIIDFVRPQVGNLAYAVPITSNREVNSDVVVENGQTIIIGGLINTKTLSSTEGVPGLKDVPIIGWLFKRDTKAEDKVSLFIFLTPYVIENPEELSKITQEHQKLAEELRRMMEKKETKKMRENEDSDRETP